ncbi:MAG: iron-containing alcohol dehydrogenase [Prolixibacteraceae bacterium]|nr:iron-containing alcohol dehydrogenase [Prolixibacteraceae bacterium]MBN2650650.1 iron-containing alcohol dehydrogenase [Prolixibacteraceae bacterium]
MHFNFSQTPMLYFGQGQFTKLADHLKSFGSKALIITSQSFINSENATWLKNTLNTNKLTASWEQMHGEPSPEQIDKITAENRSFAPDVIVAIGGGSVLDAGKAVSAMLCEKGSISNFLEDVGTQTPSGNKIPMIAVPTTAGTGSEATKNAVITKNGKDGFKKSLRHKHYVPNIAIVDPTLSLSCPPSVTAASGMDAFTQLLESYLSTQSTPISDALALDGLKMLIGSLEKAVANGDDIEARSKLSYAAFLSGITLANAGLGVVHGFAQPLGSLFPIPHGVVCALLTGSANRMSVEKLRTENKHTSLKKYAIVGRLIQPTSNDKTAIEVLLNYIERLTTNFHIPKLSAYGVRKADFTAIVKQTGLKNHPVKLNKEELTQILYNCL